MGQATDAILYYGFELFGEEDHGDYSKDAVDYIIELQDKFWNIDKHGVVIGRHCSYEYPMYYICGYRLRAARGYPEEVPFDIMNDSTKMSDCRKNIETFCKEHNIPFQEPKWMLVSYWG